MDRNTELLRAAEWNAPEPDEPSNEEPANKYFFIKLDTGGYQRIQYTDTDKGAESALKDLLRGYELQDLLMAACDYNARDILDLFNPTEV
ncbi:hypothetical protein [Latilactobacillus sakei]|uniref:Uncharacterized protein n=1 Tax=Latilactobacillus sakei TaxID=1599 RepID=A0AAE8J3I8_LATSK|nr:hypothetical protein [Latilactobacillus sakei]SPE18657.1 hypothetical protein LAS9267_00207 [Latilactobacillus sakei]